MSLELKTKLWNEFISIYKNVSDYIIPLNVKKILDNNETDNKLVIANWIKQDVRLSQFLHNSFYNITSVFGGYHHMDSIEFLELLKQNIKPKPISKPKVILVSGKMRSGKDTATDYIKQRLTSEGYNVVHKSFAEGLKTVCKNDFKLLYDRLKEGLYGEIPYFDDYLEGYFYDKEAKKADELLEKELTFTEDSFYNNKNIISRSLMEIVGTELREFFVQEAGSLFGVEQEKVDYVKDRFWSLITERSITDSFPNPSDKDVVIISDWRFPQEEDAFKDYEVIKIRMNRTFDDQNEEYSNPHISEIALDDYEEFDFVVDKEREITELHKRLDKIISETFDISFVNDSYVLKYTDMQLTPFDTSTDIIFYNNVEETDIIFHNNAEGTEILKLCSNGDIEVHGKKIENDIEVVDGLKEFLKLNGLYR